MKNKNSKNESVIETEIQILHKLKAEKDKRANECFIEIQNILKKYNCEIIPIIQLSPSGINASVDINPK